MISRILTATINRWVWVWFAFDINLYCVIRQHVMFNPKQYTSSEKFRQLFISGTMCYIKFFPLVQETNSFCDECTING